MPEGRFIADAENIYLAGGLRASISKPRSVGRQGIHRLRGTGLPASLPCRAPTERYEVVPLPRTGTVYTETTEIDAA